jgi:ComF family protein
MNILKQALTDLMRLIYPRLCLVCRNQLPESLEAICPQCAMDMPYTRFDFDQRNPFAMRFDARVPVEAAFALLSFRQKGPGQKLIHELKYRNRPEIGVMLGKEIGRALKKSHKAASLTGIVPVPLHPRKEHERGYNQSLHIALGIEEILNIPVYKQALIRNVYSTSQTKLHREERLVNARSAFQLARQEVVAGQHILLVDDVMTTGATLETCISCLLEAPQTTVSCATIGFVE